MNKEFICMEETIQDTQKKIRQWTSTGYEVNIVSQIIMKGPETCGITILVTSLWRIKWKLVTIANSLASAINHYKD